MCAQYWSNIQLVMLCKPSGATVRGEGGVAGEGKLIGVPAFHFWGKCTMLLIVSMWCTWLRKCQSAQKYGICTCMKIHHLTWGLLRLAPIKFTACGVMYSECV